MIRIIREPYRRSSTDTLREFVERYECDPNREFSRGLHHFHRVLRLSRIALPGSPVKVMVLLHAGFTLRIGDKLIDENGLLCTVLARDTACCFDPALLPFFSRTCSYYLSGNAETLGEYLAISM